MSGYTKNIAVIKGLKEGFSADGGALSGLVRAERYGGSLRVEISPVNFAPLSEGRYAAAVTDGAESVMVENWLFEGVCPVDTSQGFAAVIFYVNRGVFPVASAVCGNFRGAALGLKAFAERCEAGEGRKKEEPQKGARPQAEGGYQDEAIAEENYYEYAETDENGGAVRADAQKEEDGRAAYAHEEDAGALAQETRGIASRPPRPDSPQREKGQKRLPAAEPFGGGEENASTRAQEGAFAPLARGECFYARVQKEIEGILSSYPEETALCRTVENSRWVRISYGDGLYYVFGVIYLKEKPQYLCYGVPARGDRPPESMAGLADFIPASPEGGEGGYWVMYQDADTGASLHPEAR